MRAPLSWIREFTPVDAPVDEIVAALNQLGLEVDAVEQPGEDLSGVIVARVLGVAPHPDADKLSLVDIDDGSTQRTVVCGATNVVAGMLVPYAPAGAQLPGGITLERRKIRGIESDGMLCSPRELGLGDDHRGILDLAGKAGDLAGNAGDLAGNAGGSTALGTDVRAMLGLDDIVFDLAITPNRPDAMCIIGVARELAAHFGLSLTVAEPVAPTDASVAGAVAVQIDAPDRCPRYLARVAQVEIGPSPAWMQQRLVKAGMRPISNVVDVTNYVLLERNQPLHAFDLARLAGPGIVVRLAQAGEKMTTLDGAERTLAPDDLLICDAESVPQAIAGIMGGSTAEVDATTTSILLESAYFERVGIARSSKRLKLRSEASARFERGIDPDAIARNAERAMELLTQVAGARVSPTTVDEYPQPSERPHIRVRPAKVNAVLGTSLSAAEIDATLRPLGIDVVLDGDDLDVQPPTFRPDLEREIDFVEEVARRVGFDAIGRTLPKPRDQVGALTRSQRERRLVADTLAAGGWSEAVTVPLVAPIDLERSGAPIDRMVRVANPLRTQESALRTRVLPGLLNSAATNQARGLLDVALFEIGRVFLSPDASSDDGPLPEEQLHVAGVLTGTVARRPVEVDRSVDFYDVIDATRAVLDAMEIGDVRFVPADLPTYQVGRSATVEVSGVTAGEMGEISPRVLVGLGVSGPAVAFELDLGVVLAAPRRDRSFRAPSPFPPAVVDLAFVLDVAVPAGAVSTTLRTAAGDLLEDVRVFDDFRSDAFGSERRSLAFGLRFRAPDRTLTDEEVAVLRQGCIDAVIREHGASLRA